MVKKNLLVFFLALVGMSTKLSAQHPQLLTSVPLKVYGVDPTGTLGDGHRGPVVTPEVSQAAYILYIYDAAYAFTLRLLDEYGQEVYTAVVAAGTASVVLPATLTGTFTLQLIPGGDYYYEGEIEL